MLRFKQFENVFEPKKIEDREAIRKQLLEKEVEKEAKRYTQIKHKQSYSNLIDAVVEDIFFIWDRYNSDEREGIEKSRSGSNVIFHFDNDKFLDHVELFLTKIECEYSIPDVGTLILKNFTS